jgi:hypothetical protein
MSEMGRGPELCRGRAWADTVAHDGTNSPDFPRYFRRRRAALCQSPCLPENPRPARRNPLPVARGMEGAEPEPRPRKRNSDFRWLWTGAGTSAGVDHAYLSRPRAAEVRGARYRRTRSLPAEHEGGFYGDRSRTATNPRHKRARKSATVQITFTAGGPLCGCMRNRYPPQPRSPRQHQRD